MSVTVDERVVEMRFDNKQFEENAKESLSTLERLKVALNFSNAGKGFQGLEKATKATSLDGIAAGVDMLTKRFSTMGIVGMQVVQNITNSIQGKLARAIAAINDSIVSGGIRRAMNLEKAHFQLQSIIGDEAGVQEVMDAANKSVDGTAYSFDVAAKAASQFYASGVTDMESMDMALRSLVGTTATFSADYGQMSMIWTQVAGQGRLMGDQLLQLSTRGANAAVTIADFINGVNSGSIQASNSVTEAVRAISKGTNNTEADIRDFVSKGKVNFDVFSAAMNHAFGDSAQKANETFDGALSNIKSALARIGAGFVSPLIAQNSKIVDLFNAVRLKINDVKNALVFSEEMGNVNALSKQVTDFVLNLAGLGTEFINNLDLTKPLQVFYYGVESIKNVTRGLLSILTPIGKAFANVFLSFSMDDVVSLADGIETLTSKFRLSDRSMYNLQRTFQGLFDIIQLVGQAVVGLIGVFVPLGKPIDSAAGEILEVTGTLGGALTKFSIWIRKSPAIQKAFEGVTNAIQFIVDAFSNFFKLVNDIPLIPTIVDAAKSAFDSLGTVSAPLIEKLNEKLIDLRDFLSEVFTNAFEDGAKWFVDWLYDVNDYFSKIDFSNAGKWFKTITENVAKFASTIFSAEGISTFTRNLKDFFKSLKEGFSENKLFEKIRDFKDLFDFSKLVSKLEEFKKMVNDFASWFKNTILPTFSDTSIGGLLAAGGGVAFLFGISNIAKAFKNLSKSIKDFPKAIFGDVKDVLKQYQNDLKASQLLKIAAAIGILSATIVLLSFADFERVIPAVVVLATIAGVFIFGTAKLLEAAKSGKEASNALFQVGVGLKRAMSKLAGAVRIKAIGSTLKSFGTAIAVISGSIIALSLMYKKDSGSVKAALGIVSTISVVLVGIIALMSALGNKLQAGMKNFSKAASGVVLLSVSMALVVGALRSLLKMDIPDDYGSRIVLLGSIFAGLAALTFVIGKAAKASGGSGLKATGTIMALSLMIFSVTSALKKIFDLDLSGGDWKTRMTMLMGIFGALETLIITIGLSSKLAGRGLKAASSIVAMCAFVATTVGSLLILSLIPGERLQNGANALSIVLFTLAATFAGAGKISDKSTYKSVLSMALIVASITTALGVLSMVPLDQMVKAAGALIFTLGTLAAGFHQAGNLKKDSYNSIVAMISGIVVIAGSLTVLATQPWDRLMAATVALNATILVVMNLLKMVSSRTGLKKEKIDQFAKVVLSILPIALSIRMLASEPWQGLLASTVSLSAILGVLTLIFKTISSTGKANQTAILAFVVAAASLVPIALSLKILAGESWGSILPAMVALNGTALALSGILHIIQNAPLALPGVIAFVAAAVALVPIAAALKILAGESWGSILPAMVALNATALILSGLLHIIQAAPIALPGVLAFVGAAVALIPIAAAMKILSGLSWGDVARGLVTLAGALTIIGVAGVVIGPISPLILALSAALVVFGAGIAATGAGILIFVKSITEAVSLIDTFIGKVEAMLPKFKALGENILRGLAEGIAKGFKLVLSTIAGVGAGILAKLASVLGIHSPSTKARELGLYTTEGFSLGLEDGKTGIDNSVQSIFGGLFDDVKGPLMDKLFDTGQEGTGSFTSGLLSGEGDISSTLNSLMGDSTDIDMSSFFGTGEEGTENFMAGLLSGEGDISSMLNSIMGDSALSTDTSGFYNTGQEGSMQFNSGFQNAADNTDLGATAARLVTKLRVALNTEIAASDFSGVGDTISRAMIRSIDSGAKTINAKVRLMFSNSGTNATNGWKTAIINSYPNVAQTATTMVNRAIEAIRKQLPQFMSLGKSAANNFLNGVRSVNAYGSGQAVANSARNGMSSVSFYNAGRDAAQGFINGIRSKEGSAASAGSAIGNAAYKAAKRALAEKSPSKKMFEVGDFAVAGFVNGLLKGVPLVEKTSDKLGNTSVELMSKAIAGISDSINDDFNLAPVITPIVDLDGVSRSANEVAALFNDAIAVNTNNAASLSSTLQAQRKNSGGFGYSGAPLKAETNYNLTQINQSPKALSRIDIYRDTANLFTQFREVVEQK